MISNYTDLLGALANWITRPDMVARVPDFIALAEAKFQRLIRNRNMEQRDVATASEYLSLPFDYLEMRSFKIISTTPNISLRYIPPSEADHHYSASSVPVGYTHVANQLRIIPSPNATYTCELLFYKLIPALSGTNLTNWLLTACPDVYVYGAMLEALLDLPGDPRLSQITAAYTAALDGVNNNDTAQRWSGGPLAPRTSDL